MAVTAGYEAYVEYATTYNGSYTAINYCNNVSFSHSLELLDTTEFLDNNRDKIGGLFDATLTISGDYDGTDAGQAKLEDRSYDGNTIYIKYFMNGSQNFKAAYKVESFEISADVGGKVTFTANLALALDALSDASGVELIP